MAVLHWLPVAAQASALQEEGDLDGLLLGLALLEGELVGMPEGWALALG
jgi:hypothetical protein